MHAYIDHNSKHMTLLGQILLFASNVNPISHVQRVDERQQCILEESKTVLFNIAMKDVQYKELREVQTGT